MRCSIAKMELPVRWGSKLEVRAVVRFLAVRGEKLVEIYCLIRETYGDECPVIAIQTKIGIFFQFY